jgi:hypothetical protein
MLEQGQNSAAETDLVGPGTQYYVKTINTVAQENYGTIVINNTDTQITISSNAITVTYNL